MQMLNLKKFLSWNARTAATDLLPVELKQLKDLNPYLKFGQLIPDKGKSAILSGLTNCRFLASFKNPYNGDEVIVANDSGNLVYYLNEGSQVINSSGYEFAYRRAVNDEGILRINGLDNYTYTRSAIEPKWFGYIKRGRFWLSGPPEDAFAQNIEDYYTYKKGLDIPDVTTAAGEPAYYQVKVTLANGGAGAMSAGQYTYAFGYIYDGFQEAVYADVNVASGNTAAITISSSEQVSITIRCNKNMNRRITGVTIYRRDPSDTKWFYVDTVYLDGVDRYWTDADPYYQITVADNNASLTYLMENQLGYTMTEYTDPFYKYGIIHEDRMYVGCVNFIYRDAAGDWSLDWNKIEGRKWLYSPIGQYDVLPETNYGTLPDDISGMAKTRNYVVMFTENDMFFVSESNIRDRKKWMGCWSADSIAFYDDNIFWANRQGVMHWNGLQSVNILSKQLKTRWDSLSDAQIRSSRGVLIPEDQEYIIMIPGALTLVYNMEVGEWRERSINFNHAITDYKGRMLGTDGSYIYEEGGYSGITPYAVTGEFELDPNLTVELLKLWMRYQAAGTVTITIYWPGYARNITFAANTPESIVMKALAGYDSTIPIFGHSFQLRIAFNSPAEGDSINSIAVGFNLHDLM